MKQPDVNTEESIENKSENSVQDMTLKGMTASIRFKTAEERKRFFEVLEHRQKKGLDRSASDFIWSMFRYVEQNPYGDFSTGK
jgi:hypothetical protein